jgi:hypothetical protein
MNQRFRRSIVNTTAAAIAIIILSNSAWAKKTVHIEPAAKPAAASKCKNDFKDEIAKRLSRPKRVDEFLEMMTEASYTYRWESVKLSHEVRAYVNGEQGERRSARKDTDCLKAATGLEKAYMDWIRNGINSFAIPREETKREILELFKKCGLYKESVWGDVKYMLDRYDASKDAADSAPREWRVVKSEILPSARELEEKQKRAEIEAVMSGGENINKQQDSSKPSSNSSSFTFPYFNKGLKISSGTASDKR